MKFSVLIICFLFSVPLVHGTISDLRLCSDQECKIPLSVGVASVRYQSIEPLILSFNLGDELTIFSKEAGSNKDLWGAEVRGKRGYIPKRLVREMRVFRKPSFLVATELQSPILKSQENEHHDANSPQKTAPLESSSQPSLNGNSAKPVESVPKVSQPAMPSAESSTSANDPKLAVEDNLDKDQEENGDELPDNNEEMNDEADGADEEDTGLDEEAESEQEETVDNFSAEAENADFVSLEQVNNSDSDNKPEEVLPGVGPIEYGIETVDLPGVSYSVLNSLPTPQPLTQEIDPEVISSLSKKDNEDDKLTNAETQTGFSTTEEPMLNLNSMIDNMINSIDTKEEIEVPTPPHSSETKLTLEKSTIDTARSDDLVASIIENGSPEGNQFVATADSSEPQKSMYDESTAEKLRTTAIEASVSEEANDYVVNTPDIPAPLDSGNESETKEDIPSTLNIEKLEESNEFTKSFLGDVPVETAESLKHLESVEEVKDKSDTFITEGNDAQEELLEANISSDDSKELPIPTPVEASNAGFFDTALGWLGLGETEEPLIKEQVTSNPTDDLHQQIASMNPTTPYLEEKIEDKEANHNDITIAIENDSFSSTDQKYCHAENCGDLPIAKEADAHDHHHLEVPVQHDSKVSDHDHDHHESDAGCGHGHSHTPGLIPGFRHHYKPPVAQVQPLPSKVETQSAPPSAIKESVGSVLESDVKPSTYAVESQEKASAIPPNVKNQQTFALPPVSETQETGSTISPVGKHQDTASANLPAFTQQETTSDIPPVLEHEGTASPITPVNELQKEEATSEPTASEPTASEPTASEPLEEPLDSSVAINKEDVVPAKKLDFATDYISAEDIFRLETEKKKQLEEEEAQKGAFIWSLNYPSERSVLVTVVIAVAVVIFFGLYYQIQNKSQEKYLLAKISLLDSQISDSLSAKEECGAIQDKLSDYETLANDLQILNDQMTKDKAELQAKVSSLISENEVLQKEKDSVTESGLEASKMLQEILASQVDSDQLQNAVEVLQEQLNRQQSVMETLSASLSIKSAENETLTTEVNDLKVETDRYKVRVKTLQTDMETLKTSNRNYQQKMAAEDGELMKLKQERETWISERRSLTNQISSGSKKTAELEEKMERLKTSLKAKEGDLAKTLEKMKKTGKDNQSILELTSLVQLEKDLAESNVTIEKLTQDLKDATQQRKVMEEEASSLHTQLKELQSSSEAAVRDKLEAETRLEVLSNYFKEKETQLQKELGTHEAQRAITEENVNDTAKKIIESEENLITYKSQVETLTKEIEEQDRSYKSRLAAQEKRAHENWVTARQLERRLEEMKQEGTQLRQRLTQVEKEKETLLIAKENGTATNGGMEADVHPPLSKHLLGNLITNTDDMGLMEPPLLSPPIPPPGLDIGLGVPPPGMPGYDAMFPPGHFIPPAPFMPPEHGMIAPMFAGSAIPPPPPELVMADHRPPTLGMISSNSFDADFRRDLVDPPPPPRHYTSPHRRYPSPLGSDRSIRSDRSDRYDDHYRPLSPYGRQGGRPRSVGRSRDASPDRPERSYSPLPSPFYPSNSVQSPEDWEDRHFRPPMRTQSLRNPPGPKTSSPLIHPTDSGDRSDRGRQMPL